jgi:hypothetical protein
MDRPDKDREAVEAIARGGRFTQVIIMNMRSNISFVKPNFVGWVGKPLLPTSRRS